MKWKNVLYIVLFSHMFSLCADVVTEWKYSNAIAMAQEGKWSQAQKDMQRLMIDTPDNATLLYDNGVAAFRLSEFEKAAAYFQTVAELPSVEMSLKMRALFNLGNTKVALNALAEAVSHYQDVLAMDPENQAARHNLEKVKEMMRQQQQKQQQHNKKNNESPQSNDTSKNDDTSSSSGSQGTDGKDENNGDRTKNSDDRKQSGQQGNTSSDTSSQQEKQQSDQQHSSKKEKKGNSADKHEKGNEKYSGNNTPYQQDNKKQQSNFDDSHGMSSPEKQEQQEKKQRAVEDSLRDEKHNNKEQKEQQAGGESEQRDIQREQDQQAWRQKFSPDEQWMIQMLARQEKADERVQRCMIKSHVNKELAGKDGQNCW